MATRISCPNCRRQLLLPSDCTASVLACPQCAAEISNPQTVPSIEGVQADLPAPRAAIPTPIAAPLVPNLPDDDVDVRDHRYAPSKWTVFLSVLGGLGVSYALLLSFKLLVEGEFTPVLVVGSVLMVFTLFSAARVIGRHPHDSPGALIGRILLGTLTTLGVGVGVIVLVGVAAFIVLFVVCLANGAKC
jgi:hypothetical protein